MECKLISPLTAQLARLFRLVHGIEMVQLEDDDDGCRWAILVRGKGFNRLIKDARAPVWASPAQRMPHPIRYRSRERAEEFCRDMGLLPRISRWKVADGSGSGQRWSR